MTVPEIIAALTPYTGHFPTAAVEAAMAQPAEVTPHLLNALEEAAADPKKFASQDQMLHVFAAYLLAQFREKRAYRPLVKLLAASGELADQLFGDTITERMDRILASVYDGDPEPIKRLVEGEQVYGFVRGAAVDTFMVLTHTGQMPRQEVLDYYRDLFRGKLRRENNQVWNALTSAVADLPAPELVVDLRRAYADDLVDPDYADLEDLESDARVPFEQKEEWQREKATLVADAVSEMGWWHAFHLDDKPELGELDELGDPPLLSFPDFPGAAPADRDFDPAPGAGFRRAGPKIGRNDPCPCGSGKKYKKCCLGK